MRRCFLAPRKYFAFTNILKRAIKIIMTFTENIANILEVCKLKNLTVYKFIMELCVVLRSQLLSQVQVELEEYMQMCMVRAPFLAALKSGTVDDATFRVSVMGTVMAEWHVNRRVRQQTAKLQREIVKRQVEEQPVPCCSPAWIYQDFPSLLSETKAESLPISVLCDLILKRYDLTKDKEFHDLHCEVDSELQKQQPDQVSQAVQNGSQANQYLPTTCAPSTYVPVTCVPTICVPNTCVPTACAPRENTKPNSLRVRANWFRHYQPAQSYTEVSLFGQTGRSTVTEASVCQYNKTTNYPRQFNGHDTKKQMLSTDSAGCSSSIDSRSGLRAKIAGNSRRYNGPEVQRHNDQLGHSNCANKTAPLCESTISSAPRKYVRPRARPYKQTQGHVSISKKSTELKSRANYQKKSFDQKIEDFLSKACPSTTKAEQTTSPEFRSAHLGGLVIKIAKKPKSVQVIEPKQPREELTVKERKRQAFLAHVARIQNKLKTNMKADVQTNKTSSNRHKSTDTSVSTAAHTNHDNLDTARSPMVTEKGSSRKRKATESSVCSIIQSKRARIDTGSAVKDSFRKRKATDACLCSSIESKCSRLDNSSTVKESARKRKASDTSQCSSIQNKYARLDTGSAIKALKRHVVKRQP